VARGRGYAAWTCEHLPLFSRRLSARSVVTTPDTSRRHSSQHSGAQQVRMLIGGASSRCIKDSSSAPVCRVRQKRAEGLRQRKDESLLVREYEVLGVESVQRGGAAPCRLEGRPAARHAFAHLVGARRQREERESIRSRRLRRECTGREVFRSDSPSRKWRGAEIDDVHDCARRPVVSPETGNVDGSGLVVGRACVSELAEVVSPPALYPPACRDRAGVLATCDRDVME